MKCERAGTLIPHQWFTNGGSYSTMRSGTRTASTPQAKPLIDTTASDVTPTTPPLHPHDQTTTAPATRHGDQLPQLRQHPRDPQLHAAPATPPRPTPAAPATPTRQATPHGSGYTHATNNRGSGCAPRRQANAAPAVPAHKQRPTAPATCPATSNAARLQATRLRDPATCAAPATCPEQNTRHSGEAGRASLPTWKRRLKSLLQRASGRSQRSC